MSYLLFYFACCHGWPSFIGMTPPPILQSATSEQLEQAVAFNHRELFRQEAIALGGEIILSEGLF